jgi:hypothetical protein
MIVSSGAVCTGFIIRYANWTVLSLFIVQGQNPAMVQPWKEKPEDYFALLKNNPKRQKGNCFADKFLFY